MADSNENININSYLTIDDLSVYLGIKPKTLYAKVKEIPHYKVGRLIRFKREDVDVWMERHKVAKTEQRLPAPENGSEHVQKVSEARKPRKRRVRRGPITDIDRMVRNTIDQVTTEYYSPGHGKSDQVKGSGKEV